MACFRPRPYTTNVRIALGQINTTVGDFAGNSAKIIDYAQRARSAGADLVLFPELSICGYPPRDLVERPWFVQRNWDTAEAIARATQGIAVIVGLVTPANTATGKSVRNSAVLFVKMNPSRIPRHLWRMICACCYGSASRQATATKLRSNTSSRATAITSF